MWDEAHPRDPVEWTDGGIMPPRQRGPHTPPAALYTAAPTCALTLEATLTMA
jgi:hypothetical protein